MLGVALFAGVLGAVSLLLPRLGRATLPVALAAPVYITALALGWLPAVSQGTVLDEVHRWVPALDLELALRLDGLSLLFVLLIAGIGTCIVGYTGGYLHGNVRRTRFLIYLLLFMASMLGVVLADNVLLLFVCWELTSFTSYLLIGFNHEQAAARKAALQALLVTGVGGLCLLAGVLLMAQAADSMRLSEILATGDLLRNHPHYPWMLGLILIGAFTKSAQFPFHFWLPNAMQAPTPASAYLHSATMVKGGVYLLARLQPALGDTAPWLLTVTGIGALTLLVGAVMAIGQNALKRLLAYTTVAALGCMTMLLGLGANAAQAAMAYLFAHALYKAALFLVAGSLDHAAGTMDVTRLGGLRRTLPLTALAGLLAACSMAGLPLGFGFVAKETMLAVPGLSPALLATIVISSALMLAVGFLTGVRPFFGPRPATDTTATPTHEHAPHAPPWTMVTGPLILGATSLVFGLAPGLANGLLGAAADATAGVALYAHFALWHGWTRELGFSALTLVLGVGGILAASRCRAAAATLAPHAQSFGPERGYHATLEGLNDLAGAQTRILQSGSLRQYLHVTMLTACALAGSAYLCAGIPLRAEGYLPLEPPTTILALLTMLATVITVCSSSSLGAIAALGVVGAATALLFIYFGAPDLAMTQLVIEALTVVLLVSGFSLLPPFATRSSRGHRLIDTGVALLGGLLMAGLTLAATDVQLAPSISDYFANTSVPLGHGRNIVNVILVDYRGLDTLGEITVLAVAALGGFALLKLRLGRDKRRHQEDKTCPL